MRSGPLAWSGMPQPCSVCSHPDRQAIDRELASGQRSQRDLAGQYQVSKSAIVRHHAHALRSAGGSLVSRAKQRADSGGRGSPTAQALEFTKPNGQFAQQAQAAIAQMLSGATLAQEVGRLRTRADAICAQAEQAKDARTALLAIRELTRLLELQGRMVLEASQGRASDVSSHPVWLTLSGLILGAIGGCPTCKPRVLSVIRERLGVAVGPEPSDVPFP